MKMSFLDMKESGLMTGRKEKVLSFLRMEILTWAIGKLIR